MALKTVTMLRPYLSLAKGQTKELAARLADQLIKDGFAAEPAKSVESNAPRRATKIVPENKSVGA